MDVCMYALPSNINFCGPLRQPVPFVVTPDIRITSSEKPVCMHVCI